MTHDVVLRAVRAADEAMLLAWANDPTTRAASRDHAPIEAADHCGWLEQRLATPNDARLWIGEAAGEPVGVVRFERRSADALEVSITVAPEARGRGLAGPLLDAGLAAAREAFGPLTILADVLPHNQASLRLFARAGFMPVVGKGTGVPDAAAVVAPGVISLERR